MKRRKEADQELKVLVERTEGLQPWRRVFHATNGLLIVGVVLLSPLDVETVRWTLGIILGLLLLLDAVRLLLPRMNQLFFRIFLSLASPREEGRLASSTWYVTGALLTLLLFPVQIAAAAILVLALADPAASVVGRTFGTRRLGKGTIQGSFAFFLVAFLVVLPFASWPTALLAALAMAAAEIVPVPLDDNLVLPLASGGILTLLL